MKIYVHIVLTIITINTCLAAPIIKRNAIHHPVIATNGMVASQEQHATKIGLNILKNGGNAIDAAVAVGFALSVTLPRAGNLGGGGFMIIHTAKNNQTIALDFREVAPLLASKNMFLDEYGNVDSYKSRFSIFSAGIPGTVAGLFLAHNQFGSMHMSKLIAPSITLAEDGFTVTNEFSTSLKKAKKRLSKHAYTASIFYPNNTSPPVGATFKQADLAKSLTYISKNGHHAFYKGKIAKKLVTFMKQKNGLITSKDLAEYRPKLRSPITGHYRGYTIKSMPPPSSGGISLMQLLKLIEPYPLNEWGHNSAKTVHIMSEAMQLVYADRAEWLGDEDLVDVPKKALLSSPYLNSRRNKINPDLHTNSVKTNYGIPFESDETTHYSIIDKWGNAVSVTTTLNFSYGSGIAIPGTGILLNNEMDDFSAKPGVPNAYGLIGNKRNAIEPKKRMLSSMTPTIVFKDNNVFLVTGSPGGSRIITTVAQIISNVIDHDMNIAEATHAPRFHHQWLPDELRIEQFGLSLDTQQLLENMGHKIVTKQTMGSTQSIIKRNQQLYGSSDPRTPTAKTLGY